jgi:ABC-type nitrate/sulfonate/bicarbonate transport system substrate-binding protein
VFPGQVPNRALRTTVVLAVAALLTGAVAAAATARESPPKVRVLVLPHLSYGIFYLARELGHFAAEGVEVEFVKLEHSAGALPLLLRQALDVMAIAPSPALFHAVAAGERVRGIAGLSVFDTGQECVPNALVARPGVEIAPGARGLRVAATRANMGAFILERTLAAAGLDPSAQRFVDLAGAAELAALLEGHVDLAVVGEPRLRRALDAGAVRIVLPTRAALPDQHASLVVFGPRLLADRDLGQRFANAMFRAIADYLEGPTARNVAVLSRVLDEDQQILARSCWPPIDRNGAVAFELMQAYQRWEVARGNLDRVLDPEEYFDAGFAARSVLVLDDGRR